MFKFIGAGIGHCGRLTGAETAPIVIQANYPEFAPAWYKTIVANMDTDKLAAIPELAEFSLQLALATQAILQAGDKFINLGGDHSAAIGTWSGVKAQHSNFGLLWIDAHMDAHTPTTSHSGNLHGMPVATLLGHGDKRLTEILISAPKLNPEQIILFGVRCFEPEEQALLDKLGVKYYDMPAIQQQGFAKCWQESIAYFRSQNWSYGISFDLDGLDPKDMSSFGTPVDNGIRLVDVLTEFKQLKLDELIGIELVEYNPELDKDLNDLRVIKQIVDSLLAQ